MMDREPLAGAAVTERVLADCFDYADLHRVMRAVAEERGTSREMIDAVAGLQTGYASKLLAPKPLKRAGWVSLGPLLRTLGLKLRVVEDPEALAALAHRLPKRCGKFAHTQPTQRPPTAEEIARAMLTKWTSKAARAAHARRSPEERRELAQRAARARWRS